MAPWLVPAKTSECSCFVDAGSTYCLSSVALLTSCLQPWQGSLSSLLTLLRDGVQSSRLHDGYQHLVGAAAVSDASKGQLVPQTAALATQQLTIATGRVARPKVHVHRAIAPRARQRLSGAGTYEHCRCSSRRAQSACSSWCARVSGADCGAQHARPSLAAGDSIGSPHRQPAAGGRPAAGVASCSGHQVLTCCTHALLHLSDGSNLLVSPCTYCTAFSAPGTGCACASGRSTWQRAAG